jgi:hypothetical protein
MGTGVGNWIVCAPVPPWASAMGHPPYQKPRLINGVPGRQTPPKGAPPSFHRLNPSQASDMEVALLLLDSCPHRRLARDRHRRAIDRSGRTDIQVS